MQGRIDCAIENNDTITIYECKIGKERDSDKAQVMLYMYILSKSEINKKQIKGIISYNDKEIEITLPDNFEENFNFFVNKLISTECPVKNPGNDCRFCDITKEVWFYDMENDGFSLDDKRVKIDKNDIPDIIKKFMKRNKEIPKDRKGKCFFIPVKEIIENNYDLSISKYKEIEYEEVKYEKPEVIKKKILELEEEIIKRLKELSFE